MSEESVEIVRRYYESSTSGGLDRWMEQFAEDVEYWPAAGELGGVGPIHGRKALRAYFQDWIDTFDEFWFRLIELIDAGGDKVVTVERYGGRARLSGVEVEQSEAELFTIRDGKIAQCREYGTRAEALEAAGLSE